MIEIISEKVCEIIEPKKWKLRNMQHTFSTDLSLVFFFLFDLTAVRGRTDIERDL